MKDWFTVDRAGLARIMERRGMAFVPLELLQNAWDETGVTHVNLTMEPTGRRMSVDLKVEDDSANGFRSLTDAWTLFADSYKKNNAEQRGRFNLGEKLVLAVCRHAEIRSTSGGVRFDDGGRHTLRKKRERGTMFSADVRMSKSQCDEALATLKTLIGPPGITTTINGQPLHERVPVHTFTATLQTEIADENGVLRRTRRKTQIHVYEPEPGEEASLYEMGIPVQVTGDRWHVDVRQCVPLTLERDAVPPAFMARLRANVVNAMHDKLTEDDATEPWVIEASSHADASTEAVTRALDLRFGHQRVMLDPSDPEANRRAQAAGYTVVHPRQLPGGLRGNLRRIERDTGSKVVQPAGRMFPTHSGGVSDATRAKVRDWHKPVMSLTKDIARAVLDIEVSVVLVHDREGGYVATYGRRTVTYNVARLTPSWWSVSGGEDWDRIVRLILHELAHHLSSNHLSDDYHRACCLLGARLARACSLGTINPARYGFIRLED